MKMKILIGALIILAISAGGFTLFTRNINSTIALKEEQEIGFRPTKETKIKPPERREIGGVHLPILTYHYIRTVTDLRDVLGEHLSVTPEVFEEQLKTLQQENFTTVTLDDLVSAWESKTTLPPKPIILTFDDGYDDFYLNAYPLLKKYNMKATAYIVPGFLDKPRYMTTEQIKELARNPLITIAAHTMNHPDLRRLDKKKTLQEIIESKGYLEQLIGKNVDHFAYPFGKFTEEAVKAVKISGFKTSVITQYGAEHTEKNRFLVTRKSIIGGDSMKIFLEKITK